MGDKHHGFRFFGFPFSRPITLWLFNVAMENLHFEEVDRHSIIHKFLQFPKRH